MEITAAMVKELRERTGAGMMDCKNALVDSQGDVDKAIELLREKGLAAAAKKAGRIAADGVVDALIFSGGRAGVMAEINCETDFVAKTDNFKRFARNVVEHIYEAKPDYVSAEDLDGACADGKAILMEQAFAKDPDKTMQDLLSDATVAIGEKIAIRRFARLEAADGLIDSYIHIGGKIGVLLEIQAPGEAAELSAVREMSHDICMHIAAAAPRFVRKDEVPTDNLDKEKEILRTQALNEGKPAKIVDRMVEGRIEKYYKEICLLEQPFVKNPDITVSGYIAEKAAETGAELKAVRFIRFERGEGIEKRKDNLAEEVAAQMAK